MENFQELREAIYEGDAEKALAITEQALEENISAKVILNEGLIKGMDRVGEDFRSGELFVPEVLVSAKAMKEAMEVLRPLFAEAGVEPVGKVVIGTVKGDLHDIGKNLVAMMLEGGGLEVHDLGVDIPPEKFIEAVKTVRPEILGMSALLTTTMANMKVTIKALEEAGLREQVKIMVGGAPVTPKFSQEIGADRFAPDASSAVIQAKELLSAMAPV